MTTLLLLATLMTLDEKSAGKTVKAAAGTVIVVRLDAQPGTGYAWHLAGKPQTLTLLDTKFEPVKPAEKKVGGREQQVLRFRVTKKGTSALRLEYRRGWEKDAAPAKTFQVTIDSR